MKYKAVFSDLDFTFINKDGQISKANKEAAELLIKNGIPFIPATGRSFGSLPKALLEIKGLKYVITSNGVALYDVQAGKAVVRTTLQKGFVKDFFEFVEAEGRMAVEVYYDGHAYASQEYVSNPASFNQLKVEYVQTTRTPVANLKDFAKERDGNLDGLTIIAPSGRYEELVSKVKDKFGKAVYVTNSDGLYIELSNLLCGKHNGLKKTCEYLGIDPSETVAFGDNDNDIEMLETAGLGVCVANGTEKCKRAADKIAPECEKDGVAKEIFALIK